MEIVVALLALVQILSPKQQRKNSTQLMARELANSLAITWVDF